MQKVTKIMICKDAQLCHIHDSEFYFLFCDNLKLSSVTYIDRTFSVTYIDQIEMKHLKFSKQGLHHTLNLISVCYLIKSN